MQNVRPSFIVDDVNCKEGQGDSEEADESKDSEPEEGDKADENDDSDCFDSVCAICDNGGDLYMYAYLDSHVTYKYSTC